MSSVSAVPDEEPGPNPGSTLTVASAKPASRSPTPRNSTPVPPKDQTLEDAVVTAGVKRPLAEVVEEMVTPVDAASNKKKKRTFFKEVKHMLYGFGNANNHPPRQSVEVLEDIVVEFVQDMTRQAMSLAGSNKIRTEHLMCLIRNDAKKLGRAKELLHMEKEIQNAKKLVDTERIEEPT